ncbi:MAG: hypothetical protein M3O36_06710 [Myxococcota bacterium]|nr:hypothetical protein [Myxococcota bacterium]
MVASSPGTEPSAGPEVPELLPLAGAPLPVPEDTELPDEGASEDPLGPDDVLPLAEPSLPALTAGLELQAPAATAKGPMVSAPKPARRGHEAVTLETRQPFKNRIVVLVFSSPCTAAPPRCLRGLTVALAALSRRDGNVLV